jgi:hypothetical protein
MALQNPGEPSALQGCWTFAKQLLIVGTIVVVVVLFIGQIIEDYDNAKPGRTYKLNAEIMAPTSDAAFENLRKAEALKDSLGVEQLINEGEVVLLQPGINVLMLENHLTFWSMFGGDSTDKSKKTLPTNKRLVFIKREVRVLDGYALGKIVLIYYKVLGKVS